MRASLALAPLGLTPVLFWVLGSGAVDLGGGEKDLVWILPWLLWSTTFAISMVATWLRGRSPGRSIAAAALAGFVVLVVVAVLLAGLGQLGIAGR
jgi:hypothetical protein